MSELFDDLPDGQPVQAIWAGSIAAPNVSDFATRVNVIIPALSKEIVWRDLRWQARNSIDFPQEGDDCLVVFDDNNELWVVAWWPFS